MNRVSPTTGISCRGAHDDTRRGQLHAKLAGPGRPQLNAISYFGEETQPHRRQQLSRKRNRTAWQNGVEGAGRARCGTDLDRRQALFWLRWFVDPFPNLAGREDCAAAEAATFVAGLDCLSVSEAVPPVGSEIDFRECHVWGLLRLTLGISRSGAHSDTRR